MDTVPKGATNAQAYLVGFTYLNGPFLIGASWYGFDSQGAPQLTGISQRHENAFAAGGNYQITPGLQAYFEYLYGTRHQGDYDFVSSSVGTADNNVKSQALLVGLEVGW
jgi:predicted porin